MEASTLTHASSSGLLARRSPLLRLQSDDKLVGLIREHHDRAFEVLFDRYQSRLLAFCRGMLSSSEDAEDVLQEVFVNAHAAMLADSRPINARPWLYRIARNRCLNHLRKPVPEGQDSMDIHESNGAGTLERVQRREELRAIFADVGELPETQRTALVLREIDDLSYDEIAEAMGTTLPAVKSLLVRARMSLAEASESRILDCNDVRLLLAEAAEGLCKLDGASRHHVRKCEGCGRYRSELRSSTKALAGLSPVFSLWALKKLIAGKLFGGSSSGGAASSAGSAGGAGASGAGTAGAGAGATGAGAGSAGLGAGAVGGAAAGTSGAAIGGGAAGAGLASSGIGTGLAGGALGAVGAKAAAGFATAALLTAGAVGVQNMASKGDSQSATTASAHARVAGYPRAATGHRAMSSHATGGASTQATPASGPATQHPSTPATDPKATGDTPPPADTPPSGSTTGDPNATTPPDGATGGAVDGSGGDPDASGQSGDPPPVYGGPTPDPPPVVTPPPTPEPSPPPIVLPPEPQPPPTPDPPTGNGPPPTTNGE